VNKVRVSLVGPAISTRYGDISEQVPLDVKKFTFSNLRESDDLSSIALSCFDGSISLARHWKEDTPDCVLVIADRTETLGVSATAAIMQIPLIHLQGGEVSGSIDDKIRDTNSKLADLHLTTNKLSQKKLLELGENKEDIKIIGCPSIDLVKKVMDNVAKNLSHIHNFDKIGVGSEFEIDSNYGIIMFHPDTVNEFENIEWVNRIIEMVEKSNIYF
jgi:UDP-N-acetylglucosamine 2-epimerase